MDIDDLEDSELKEKLALIDRLAIENKKDKDLNNDNDSDDEYEENDDDEFDDIDENMEGSDF